MDELHRYTQGEDGKLYNSVNLKITELIESHSDLACQVRTLHMIIGVLRAKLNRGDFEDAKKMMEGINLDD